jgi:hypothetical protein
VFNREAYNKFLLTHELYHFHITEYCARLLREEIKINLKNKILRFDLSLLKEKILDKENELQYLYDEETMHGVLLGKQVEWQKKVDSMLLTLKDYNKPIIYKN